MNETERRLRRVRALEAARRTRHRINGRLLIIVLASTIISTFVVLALNTRSEKNKAHESRLALCRGSNEGRTALRKVLQLAERAGRNDSSETPEQRARSRRFFHDALALVRPLDCEAIASGTTDVPTKTTPTRRKK